MLGSGDSANETSVRLDPPIESLFSMSVCFLEAKESTILPGDPQPPPTSEKFGSCPDKKRKEKEEIWDKRKPQKETGE